jgi:tripartite-type tricarboxylate transporter receptor subunit TctC
MHVKRNGVVLAAAILCGAPCFAADHWPTKTIRVIAAGAAGGPIDIMSRVVMQKLSDQIGQSIVIDNRGGAGGTLATRVAVTANPDGHTLLCNSSQYVASYSLYKDPGYNAYKDFIPVINAGSSPNIIFVTLSTPANNLKELIVLGRTKKLQYGSAGAGSTPHLTGERLLKLMAKLDIEHIPYSSAMPAVLATISGQVPIGLTAMPPSVPLIKAGKIRGIAVTSLQRNPSLPDVSTVAEQGFPGYEDYTWIAYFAPTGVPKTIVARLNKSIAEITLMPDVKTRLAALGFDPVNNTPEQFAKYVNEEITKWAKVIKESGAKAD